jgi:hypothetical protein
VLAQSRCIPRSVAPGTGRDAPDANVACDGARGNHVDGPILAHDALNRSGMHAAPAAAAIGELAPWPPGFDRGPWCLFRVLLDPQLSVDEPLMMVSDVSPVDDLHAAMICAVVCLRTTVALAPPGDDGYDPVTVPWSVKPGGDEVGVAVPVNVLAVTTGV